MRLFCELVIETDGAGAPPIEDAEAVADGVAAAVQTVLPFAVLETFCEPYDESKHGALAADEES